MEEQILELTRQVTILNERLPNHIDWSIRNIDDHEKRIRDLEVYKWKSAGIATLISIAATVVATISWNVFK